MNAMQIHPLSVVLLIGTSAIAAPSQTSDPIVADDFTKSQLAGRDLSPSRGQWKIADGTATCTQDDELYKKNKDHGPIIWYDLAMTDGTIRFAVRPQECKTFVFTLNNEKGHVFRFIMTPAGLSVRAWPTQGHDANAVALLPQRPGSPALKDGEWSEVALEFEGDRCTLSIGKDFNQTFENPAIGYSKTKLGLGFSFGSLSVRDVSVTGGS
jgi:hypothetical protein